MKTTDWNCTVSFPIGFCFDKFDFMCHSERSEKSLSKQVINSTEILRRFTPQNDLLYIIATQF